MSAPERPLLLKSYTFFCSGNNALPAGRLFVIASMQKLLWKRRLFMQHDVRERLKGSALSFIFPDAQTIPVGVVVRKSPGASRWARWVWQATGLLPGAGPADWKVLHQDDDVTEYHAATVSLDLYVSDTEAYAHELQARTPSVYVVMRPDDSNAEMPWRVALVTCSPYDAQDYCDSSEELVERIPMPEGMIAWVGSFIARHHVEEPFVKRKRRIARVDRIEDGIGDPRISQTSDVYRAPRRREVLN